MSKLREYQQQDLLQIEEILKQKRSVLYQLPTGGGKSVVISQFIEDNKNKNILIFAHKQRLLTQLKTHLLNREISTGLMFAGTEENLDSNIMIISIRTAVKEKRLNDLLEKDWDYVIIDEARHCRTSSYDKVLDTLFQKHPKCKLLGVDATPYRKDGKRLDKHFEEMIVSSEDVKTLIDKGFLAKYRTFVAPIGDIEENVKEVANDYQQSELSKYMRKQGFLDYIVKTYNLYGEGRQAIVFAVDIEHSKDIVKTFIEAGIEKVCRIDSTLNQKQIDEIFKQYENGDIQILVNVEMLTEGVDLPNTGCIIGARPTKSLTLYLQMIGRGTRLKQDGSDLIVLDCCGWTQEYGQLSSKRNWSLDPEVNPNSLRLQNKIIGKKSDGTTVEDLTDFMGEVAEITPQEYLKDIEGGLQKAEEINKNIDELIIDKLKEFEGIINKVRPHLLEEFNIEYDTSGSYIQIRIINKVYSDFRGTIDFSRSYLYCRINDPWRIDQDLIKVNTYYFYTYVIGIINGIFLEKNLENKLRSIEKQVKELIKTKIDTQELEYQKRQHEEEQRRIKIDELVKQGFIFMFDKNISLGSYFKDRGIVNKMKITKDKINIHHNTVEFYIDDIHKKTKEYVSAEKIYEILNDHWK